MTREPPDAKVTANLRPNPLLFADWEYLPLGSPAKQNPDLYSGVTTPDYLKNNTEGDIGLSYLIERGHKRQARYQAAKDITAQTRSLVADNERGLSFQVATLFVNVVRLRESSDDRSRCSRTEYGSGRPLGYRRGIFNPKPAASARITIYQKRSGDLRSCNSRAI